MRNLICMTAIAALWGVTGCSGDTDAQSRNAGAPPKRPAAQLVEVVTVSKEDLNHQFERTGTLRALNEARIFSQEEGAVLKVPVREGDVVATGDLLVRLDDRVITAELAKATARRKQLQSDAVRLERLGKKNLATEEALTKVETELEVARAEERLLETRRGYMTITAPFGGTIAERLVNPGDIAPKHRHLVTLVDPTSLVTELPVSELLLPGLQLEDPVTVKIDALGDQPIKGRIHRIYPTVDPQTRRGRIEIVLDKVPAQARAGQFCRVTLNSRRADTRVVNLTAVRRDERGEYLFAVQDGRARRVEIRSGLRSGDRIELLTGPDAGTKVVAAGFLDLRDGSAVSVVNAGSGTAGPDNKPLPNKAQNGPG